MTKRETKACRVCVFTGTRAEYGLLRPVIRLLSNTDAFDMRLVVSGTHLACSYGNTVSEIVADGYRDFEQVEILMDNISDSSVCTSMGLGVMRYGEVLSRLRPDIVLLLGDRYEALAFACAATVCRVPIAHIHGGELTLGAMDDIFRHAITKMSHLHFAATERYRQRIIQMGEHEERVFNVGALGVENTLFSGVSSRFDVAARLGIGDRQPYFLVTYHPVTLDSEPPAERLEKLLALLDQFREHVTVITGANADQGGAELNRLLEKRASEHPGRLKFFLSLGASLYHSAARYADVVIGNSSSGIIEVPSLGVPVVNIGDRQLGRDHSEGVLCCDEEPENIGKAIKTAFTEKFREIARTAPNPYYLPGTAGRILECLQAYCGRKYLKKGFYDLY